MKKILNWIANKWPHFDIVIDGKIYLRRYFLFKSRWGCLFLHNIRLPDHGDTPHDHPWNFWSLVLRGGYAEQRWSHRAKKTMEIRLAGSFSSRKREDIHLIVGVLPNTWTLVWTGKAKFIKAEGKYKLKLWYFCEPRIDIKYMHYRIWYDYLGLTAKQASEQEMD